MKSLPIKNILYLLAFLSFTPLTIFLSMIAIDSLCQEREENFKTPLAQTKSKSSPHLYAALPQVLGTSDFEIQSNDARVIIIEKYLKKYNSPLIPYAQFIVETSDKYSLDWRLLVAIAQQESNLGKKIPPGTYNAWGWGIHSRGTLGFSSWEEGIETVSKGLKEKYIDKGYITPEEIMSKYTPLSNGSWAFGVNQFINELEYGKVN
jgi:hypothetical protein